MSNLPRQGFNEAVESLSFKQLVEAYEHSAYDVKLNAQTFGKPTLSGLLQTGVHAFEGKTLTRFKERLVSEGDIENADKIDKFVDTVIANAHRVRDLHDHIQGVAHGPDEQAKAFEIKGYYLNEFCLFVHQYLETQMPNKLDDFQPYLDKNNGAGLKQVVCREEPLLGSLHR